MPTMATMTTMETMATMATMAIMATMATMETMATMVKIDYSRGNFFVSIFFNSNDNDDDSYYRSLNVFVVYLLQYPKHICAFVILFVHLLMMMMMLMMRMMRTMTNMEFVEIKICGNSFKSYLHIVHCN